MKRCRSCGVSKPLSEFYRHHVTADGYRNYCKSCSNITTNDWIARHPERRRDAHHRAEMKRQHGMTDDEYDALYADPRCAGCGLSGQESRVRLHVDHDHATGTVRGLLCNSCNRALGFAKDNPWILRSLADYIDPI